MERLRIQCRCVDPYDGYRCVREATNEDGLCDGCALRPSDDYCPLAKHGTRTLATELVVLS